MISLSFSHNRATSPPAVTPTAGTPISPINGDHTRVLSLPPILSFMVSLCAGFQRTPRRHRVPTARPSGRTAVQSDEVAKGATAEHLQVTVSESRPYSPSLSLRLALQTDKLTKKSQLTPCPLPRPTCSTRVIDVFGTSLYSPYEVFF